MPPGHILSDQARLFIWKKSFGSIVFDIIFFLTRHGAGVTAHSGSDTELGKNPGI
jgi:hypothetical protein